MTKESHEEDHYANAKLSKQLIGKTVSHFMVEPRIQNREFRSGFFE